MTSQLRLRALLLADHIYRDEGSSKHVIAGTFHQLNLPAFPATFGRSVGVFISFCGVAGKAAVCGEAHLDEVLRAVRPQIRRLGG